MRVAKKKVKIEMVKKDFDINEGIELPLVLSYHKVDESHLYIALEKATWLSTDDVGNDFVNYFREGL